MTKKTLFLLAVLAIFSLAPVSCQDPLPVEEPEPIDQPEEKPADLSPVNVAVPVTDNWVFASKPRITFQLENPNAVAVTAKIKVKIKTDKNASVTTIEQEEEVPANQKKEVIVTTPEALEPGFYNASCTVGKIARAFVFGISPTQIVSAPDYQADFNEFWENAKAQLAGVEMNPELTEITAKSTAAQKAYLVEMQSVPDGPEGDPVTIRGYYLEPQDGQKHPVILHFFGYDEQKGGTISCPYGSSTGQYAEFYLSTRGQMLNNRPANKRDPDGKGDFVNTYGDWFAFNFGKRDSYYYRGAFMDCVQAVRFMASRETSDMTRLFGEGASQGGAFSYAAAALSDYPFTAIAPCVAFLGDFPDYFSIVTWPGDTARKNKGSMTDEEMYAFLSYFDTKNLATRITSTAVIACIGLQDGTCPPHTNIAPYNNLVSTDKEMHYYPQMKHSIPTDWSSKYMQFFKQRGLSQ